MEAQQADREEAGKKRLPPLPPEESARLAARRTIELARARAVHDLEHATVPAHRAMLEAALAALDDQLAAISRDQQIE